VNYAITLQREAYDAYLPAALPLYEKHWREVCWRPEKFPLAPDHERYRALEKAGALRIYTAREAGILLGYAVFVVTRHLHYRDVLVANNDLLFVDPARRGAWLGVKLLKLARDSLKAEGVQAVSIRMKDEHAWGAIARRVGFEPMEQVWIMWSGV